MKRFEAKAHFSQPVHGTTSRGSAHWSDCLFAREPLAAAKKWYWRLDDDERWALASITISAPVGHNEFGAYRGAPVVYVMRCGALSELGPPETFVGLPFSEPDSTVHGATPAAAQAGVLSFGAKFKG